MQILLVDDEAELVSTLAERLHYRKIKADWVTSAEDALKLVQTNKYDLALLDVRMPKINGFELKKKLQAQNPEMKFIFLTGHGSGKDHETGSLEAGESNYLIKPLNIEILLKKINDVLKK